jgi:hypothetical protein
VVNAVGSTGRPDEEAVIDRRTLNRVGGKSLFEIGTAHLNVSPTDPDETRAEVTPSLSWALLKALEKAPPQRPPTATAFASLLHVAAERR